jgi:hypothetical protein
MKMKTDPVSKTLFSSYLEFRKMDKVYKRIDCEQKICLVSSKPFCLYVDFYLG